MDGWIGFRSRGGGGGLGAILTGLCWCLHLDLGFKGDGVVHQEPIRGVVKVGQRDEVVPSPTFVGNELPNLRTVLLATLFWQITENEKPAVTFPSFGNLLVSSASCR